MGDKRRFDLFAKLIAARFDRGLKVADVAGGQGYLQVALREQGFADVTTFDRRYKRASNRLCYRHRYFAWDTDEKFDLVVGMHPDEGSDHIVKYATKHKVPYVICPCCIKPDAALFKAKHEFRAWVAHLRGLAPNLTCEEFYLKMNGKNLVMIGR